MTHTRVQRALLLARTVRHLKPAQVLHRLRLGSQHAIIGWAPGLFARRWTRRVSAGAGWPPDFQPIDEQAVDDFPKAEDVAQGRFRLLDVERSLGAAKDWFQADAPLLWRYHLHYIEWAWPFAAHTDRDWAKKHFGDLWLSWRRSVGFGRDPFWSPYVASVRAWTLCGVYRPLVAGTAIEEEYLSDLALHARFLRTHLELDVGGNHLIKNLKALIGLGAALHEAALLENALSGLEKQLPIQVLSDGGHFERSPSYHCQVLGDFLDVSRLLCALGAQVPEQLTEAIARMRNWLGMILMPDGDVPLFNDSSLVGANRLAALQPTQPTPRRLVLLDESGYVVLRPNESVHLVADVGLPCPWTLPAHAHADCLSFELAIDGRRTIVNSGTSTYDSGDRRAYERSTRAHNSVEVDGADQTEVWGAFRAARRAVPTLECLRETPDSLEVAASHNGYRRLKGRPRHLRTWIASADQLRVVDRIEGRGKHQAAAFLHAPLDLGPIREDERGYQVGAATVTWSGSPMPDISVISGDQYNEGWIASGFNRRERASTIIAAVEADLPIELQLTVHYRSE